MSRRDTIVRTVIAQNAIHVSFIAMVIIFTVISPNFLSVMNIKEILLRASILSFLAYGIMFSLTVKGIDLSIGAALGLSSLVLVIMLLNKIPFAICFLLAVLTGGMVGFTNGAFISKFKLSPIIVTLSISFIGNSIERIVTGGGRAIYLSGPLAPKVFKNIYRGTFLKIPVAIIIMVAITVILYLFLERTKYGRRMYAGGMSEKGALVVGIRVKRYYFIAYVLSGICAGISGVIVASQIHSAQPLVGQSFIWDALCAAYLSIILSKHGRPNILGAFYGVIIIIMLNSGLTMAGAPFYWKEIIRGFVLLAILLVYFFRKRGATN